MKNAITLSIALLFGFCLAAQSNFDSDSYIENELIDYSLVLKYRDSIGLSTQQEKELKAFYANSDFDFKKTTNAYNTSLRQLKDAIDSEQSDENILKVFNTVLSLESEIKKHRLRFLLHSRKILTESQRNHLRLIGRSNELTGTDDQMAFFAKYVSERKPLYKVIGPDGSAIFIDQSALRDIDHKKITSIEVDKNVNVNANGVKLMGQDLITVRVNDVSVQNQVKVRVRGKRSALSGNLQPMIIIIHRDEIREFENMASEEILKGILPDDIEKIEVLKGEKAVSTYGRRAGGGVIIINLKDKAKYEIK